MVNKSNHLVTVSREYIEELEKFYEKNKLSETNICGKVMRAVYPNSKEIPTLFLDENDITKMDYHRIVILDDNGKEKKVFIKFPF